MHIIKKPPFADEHYVQTTLAKAKTAEQTILPVSLTFATFGKKAQYTVWGDGAARPFRLDAAEWHAVQFGALSMEAMDKMHELCAYDLDVLGPGDDDKDLPAVRPARTKAGPYAPDRLQCAVPGTTPGAGKFAPCFLFGRKIHSEAVPYFTQLTAEFFLERHNASLRAPFTAARKLQRAPAAAETAFALAGEGARPPGDYATAHVERIAAFLPNDVLRGLHAYRDSAR